MKYDIILAGVGGQGILSIATVIGYTALESGLNLKQAEVHGMSQRGGDVQSHLRISDSKIFSDLIPEGDADMILSVEPMESLRYLPYLSTEGWLITNTKPYKNINNYPEEDKIMDKIKSQPKNIALDADAIAREVGNPRGMNMVMTGCAAEFIEGIEAEKIEEGIKAIFGRKGEKIVASNIAAFHEGLSFSRKNR
ncbi:MAG: indolepyruvate oxidoreductase subunit beta [bacterium]